MQIRNVTSVFVFCLLLTTATAPEESRAQVLLSDSFESGNMAKSNADGFKWASNNRTSIVTMSANDGPVMIWQNGTKYVSGGSGKDWTAFDGVNSLRFRYAPYGSSESGDDKHWSEQRFNLGKPTRELWIRYWVRVPTNFTHQSLTGGPSNNKFFAIWSDVYTGTGSVGMTFEFWSGDGVSRLAWHHPRTGHMDLFDFIRWPQDRGRWMEVTVHLKMASSPTAKDGVLEFWQRWENETQPTKRFSRFDLDGQHYFPPSGQSDGFFNGYLLGYHNSGYAQETEWLIDDFSISNGPFTASTTSSRPRPPSDVAVQ